MQVRQPQTGSIVRVDGQNRVKEKAKVAPVAHRAQTPHTTRVALEIEFTAVLNGQNVTSGRTAPNASADPFDQPLHLHAAVGKESTETHFTSTPTSQLTKTDALAIQQSLVQLHSCFFRRASPKSTSRDDSSKGRVSRLSFIGSQGQSKKPPAQAPTVPGDVCIQ